MASVDSPISPHAQIYKPQLTSILSITHRMTGIVLSLGSLLLCYWLLTIASGEVVYTEFLIHSDAWYGQVILMSFVFSYFYHFCNGIRHLFWDAGLGLEIESAYKSGYAVIVASIFLSAATYYLARVVT
ncbi:MAG: succinate dehydrogenase, cytochrome b556 subunit [Gammaproteobacteria bacterium]|nr:succinate dehydrogenase, cytochrome b556 subunit [Gammaproteobacteria bacterium]